MDNPLSASVVDLAGLVAIGLVVVMLRVLRWFVRIPLATLIGWPIVIGVVKLHWHLLMLAAVSQMEQEWIAAHDSGPLVGSLLFGWAYALAVVLVAEGAMLFVGVVIRVLQGHQAQPGAPADVTKNALHFWRRG